MEATRAGRPRVLTARHRPARSRHVVHVVAPGSTGDCGSCRSTRCSSPAAAVDR